MSNVSSNVIVSTNNGRRENRMAREKLSRGGVA